MHDNDRFPEHAKVELALSWNPSSWKRKHFLLRLNLNMPWHLKDLLHTYCNQTPHTDREKFWMREQPLLQQASQKHSTFGSMRTLVQSISWTLNSFILHWPLEFPTQEHVGKDQLLFSLFGVNLQHWGNSLRERMAHQGFQSHPESLHWSQTGFPDHHLPLLLPTFQAWERCLWSQAKS